MNNHPLVGAGPLALVFSVVMSFGALAVAMGAIEHLKYKDREWAIEWERILVALLEISFGIIVLWKIDQWVRLLIENGGAR